MGHAETPAGRRLGRAGSPDEGSAWEGEPWSRGARPMDNAVLIGLSRQIALHRELEVVANNIANINTTGYKSDGSVFHEFLMPGASANQFKGADQRMSFVHDRATWHDFGTGPVNQTGNPLDIAL